MARISDLHKKWMKEPKYKKAYDALEEEFVLAGAVIDVRNRAGLTQEELARRMGTTQPAVARLESRRTRPSMRTLERLAEAGYPAKQFQETVFLTVWHVNRAHRDLLNLILVPPPVVELPAPDRSGLSWPCHVQ